MTAHQLTICFYVIITAFAVNCGLYLIIIGIDYIYNKTSKYLKRNDRTRSEICP
jgi:hypothetical protein